MREILKPTLKVGGATLAGLLSWVVAGKVIAITLGAAGIGLFGLLRQLLQNLVIFASFNGQAALVQGIASQPGDPDRLRYAGSVFRIQGLIAGAFALALLLGSPWLGPWLIPHTQGTILLRWLSVAMLAMVGQGYAIGLLSSYRMVNELVMSQMMGPLAVLVLVAPMIWLIQDGSPMGFVLLLAGPPLAVTWVAVRKARQFGRFPSLKNSKLDRSDGMSFFRMSTVLFVTGLIGTGTQYFQCWLVARQMGLVQSGQFWTAWSLSMSYVTLLLSSMGVYYMPSLSRLTVPGERRAFIRQYLLLAMLTMPILVSMVAVFKPWAILALFSSELLPAIKILRWMVIGDFLKGISWVLSFPMLAFNDLRWFFWTETLFCLGMAGLTWIWVGTGGSVEGLGVLFLLNYLLYLPVMIYYLWSAHGFQWSLGELGRFLAGLAMVLLVSAFTWRDVVVRGRAVALLSLSTAGFLAMALRGTGWRKSLPPNWPTGRTGRGTPHVAPRR